MDKIKVKQIAEALGGELVGNGELEISGVKDIKSAGPGDVAFILHPRYAPLLENTKASCVIVPAEIKEAKCAIIRVKNPQLTFATAVKLMGADDIPHPPKGIHKTAVIAENATIGKDVAIGPYVVIESGAVIGDRTIIYPFTYIGSKTSLGADCIIYSNVSIREKITIGSRVIIHGSTVIGADGFGYDSSTGVHVKIPQIGTVVIEDDVEIGANVAIDRAKFDKTRIGRGTKIDNLVQIAHNVNIGENCIIVAQCGISGSCTLGKYVIMGGQVGMADHITLGDGTMVGAQTGITKSFPPKSIILGSPARPIMETKKIVVLEGRLPEIYERLKKIESALNLDKK